MLENRSQASSKSLSHFLTLTLKQLWDIVGTNKGLKKKKKVVW